MTAPGKLGHMDLALAEARAAAARGEVPIGAVIVAPSGEVIARAGNRTRELADPTAHAEILAIRAACAPPRLRAPRRPRPLRHARTLCDVRHRDLVRAHPPPLLGRLRPKGGGIDHGPRIFSHPTCHHVPELYGGLAEVEAATLLREFFAGKRD